MTKEGIPYLSFVGRSNTGKTTVIERLIPILCERGLKVAVIKHHPHDFDIDIPGKDTYRYKQAGATMSILASPGKVAVVEDTEKELSLEEIITRYVHDVDLLLIEGFKRERVPKIEVFKKRKVGIYRCGQGIKILLPLLLMNQWRHPCRFSRGTMFRALLSLSSAVLW